MAGGKETRGKIRKQADEKAGKFLDGWKPLE